MNNNQKIRNLIDKAFHALDALEQSNPPYKFSIGANTRTFLTHVNQLSFFIKDTHPVIFDIIKDALNRIELSDGSVNAYSFGALQSSLEILDSIFPNIKKKIFISHSTKDKEIVNQFTQDILIAGCHFNHSEVFCTLDHSTIHTGEDFRNEIVRGMKECDFILLMFSKNYKTSDICLNEMGAAWALENKTVLPFVLPDCSFEEMGFPYQVKQCAKITDKIKLDELYKDICETYNIQQDWPHFNQCKENFVKKITGVKDIVIESASTNNLGPNEKKAVEILSANPSLSLRRFAETMGISTRHAQIILSDLSRYGIIHRTGTLQNAKWEIVMQ